MIQKDSVLPKKEHNFFKAPPNAPDEAVIIVNSSFLTEMINKKAANLFGYLPKKIIGQSLEILVPGCIEYVNKIYKKNHAGESFAGGTVVLNGCKKDGTIFPLELSLSPLITKGELLVYVSLRDISYLQKSEDKIRKQNGESDKKIQVKADELAEERNLFKTLIDSLLDYIYVKDKKLRYTIVNQSLVKALGLRSQDEIIGKNVLEILSPETGQENFDEDRNVIESGEPVINREEFITTLAGKDLWLLGTKIPLKDSQGNIRGLLGIRKDITQWKKEEKKSKASHEQLLFHLENSPMAVIEWTNEISPVYWSRQAEKIFGWNATQVTFKHVNWLERVYPEDQAGVKEMVEQMLCGLVDKSQLQCRNYTRDGRLIWCEWFNSVLKDKNGKVLIILSFVQDISKRKTFEENIRRSEMKLNEARAVAYLGNWEMDFIRKKLIWSSELYTIFGIRKNEVRPSRKLLLSLIHPDDMDSAKKILVEYYDRFKESSFNFRFIKKDGFIRHGFSKWKFEFDKNGKPVRAFGIIQDQTELRKTEEELRKANKKFINLSSLLQNVREQERLQISRDLHDDLGQQLTGLRMNMSWLNKKLNTEDEIVKEKLNSMIELIDETVHSIRRISAQLRPAVLDDLGLIAALEWHSEEVSERSGIKVTINPDMPEPDIPTAVTVGLFRIYQEVLTNAVRHANASEIVSNLKFTNNRIILKIKDDGQGMSPAIAGTKKTLGLIGIKERTFVLGGKFELKSEPEKGTEIQISIPL